MSKILLKLSAVLLGLTCAISMHAQNVSGVVRDASGEPVIGAFVMIQGTTTGTTTGIDGDYVISVPDPSSAILEFSLIGMKTVTVPVSGRAVIDVVLEEDANMLEETVVIGYATVKRRDLLGSVSSVSSDKLVEQPVTTVSQALTGKMAGVSVVTTEGDPDADIKIRVRGGGSITQDSSPLYIVDGFPVENINDISSSEIQSIDVLKDAFSTAIYGSRGANGVVIVTTKSASRGNKTSVSFNTYYGLKKMARRDAIVPMDSENFTKFQYELGSLRDNLSSVYNSYFGTFDDIDQFIGLPTNDYIGAIFGNTGNTYSADLTVSGRGDSFNWTLGYAHLNENAIMLGSNYARNNLSFKGQYKPGRTTTVDVNLRYSRTNVRGAGANSLNDQSGSNSGNGRLKHAVIYQPIPVTATLAGVDEEEDYGDAVNPLLAVSDNDVRKLRETWNANAAFTWEPVENLRLKTEGGMETYDQVTDRYYGMSTYIVYNFGGLGPVAKYQDDVHTRYRNTNTISYNFAELLRNDDHTLDIMLGEEMTLTRSNQVRMQSNNLPTFYDAMMAWNFISSGTPTAVVNYYYPDDNMLSFFGRVNYDYLHRYSIGATLRADGSSKFAKGNRWGIFPSAAVSWTISNEPWMQHKDWVDQLKLRYSFGTAGNNNIPTGQIVKVYSPQPVSEIAASISSGATYLTAGTVMNNPDLTWETTYTHNVGLDFSFFRNRLSGSIEAYQNDTKDLLINFPISGTGYATQYRNIGSTRNRGLELTLSMPLVSKQDFSLNIGGNIAYNRNKVTSLGGLDKITDDSGWASSEISADYVVEVGKPLGNMSGYLFDGFYTTDDMSWNGSKWVLNEGVPDASSLVGSTFMRPGAPKFKSIDDDIIPDKVIIGNAAPDFTGGFSLNGYIKGFDFSANFNFMVGNDVYNANKIEFNSSRKFTTLRNLTNMMEVENRWTNIDWNTGELINDAATLNAINAGKTVFAPFTQNAIFSDWAVEDGSFLRLQSATIGYTLPEKLTGKINISRARLYVTGTNLLLLTKYSGYDPEVDTRRTTPLTPGVDYSAYPKSIGVVFGLNLDFGFNSPDRPKESASSSCQAALAKAEADAKAAWAAKEAAEKAAGKKIADLEAALKSLTGENAALKNQPRQKDLFDQPVIAYFTIGKSVLSATEIEHVKAAARDILASGNKVKFTLAGHADTGTGSEARNEKLAAERAQTVYNLMKEMGVDAEMFTVTSSAEDIFDTPEFNRCVIIEKQ